MKILKCLLLSLLVLSSNNCICFSMLSTGEEYWEKAKSHYHLTIDQQFRPIHQNYSSMGPDFFDLIIELDRKNELRCPISFLSENKVDKLSLEINITPGGVTQLQLFLAFNDAMLEILDTFGKIYDTAKYVRTDFTKAQGYTSQVLIFLKRAQNITEYVFKGKKENFDEEKFLNSLKKTQYISASTLNAESKSWKENIQKNYEGVYSIEQYMDYFTNLYSKIFSNQYFFFKSHLISKENKTRLNLNRQLDGGGLKDFKYNLTTVNLLESLHLNCSQNNTNSFNDTYSGSQIESIPSIAEAKIITSPSFKQDEPVVADEKLVARDAEEFKRPLLAGEKSNSDDASLNQHCPLVETKKADAMENIIIPLIEKNEKDVTLGQTLNFDFDRADRSIPDKISVSQKKNKEKSEKQKEDHSSKLREHVDKIKKINSILENFDGGPCAGMKTRKFLRLCAALNDEGFFSDFSANKKEVSIKTNDLVTVLHTNHSGNKKSPGISNNTAKKLQEVIEGIQKRDS